MKGDTRSLDYYSCESRVGDVGIGRINAAVPLKEGALKQVANSLRLEVHRV